MATRCLPVVTVNEGNSETAICLSLSVVSVTVLHGLVVDVFNIFDNELLKYNFCVDDTFRL